MHRFYITQDFDNDKVSISAADQLHHLRDVLRLKPGDEVVLFDNRGDECVCVIDELQEKQAVLAVRARKRAAARTVRIAIACAIPKQARMDDIIDSLTQVGVDEIIPMETERVIVRLDQIKGEARLERWRRIAQSAAGQSQRGTVPLIEPLTPFPSVVSRPGFDLKLIPTLAGERKHIREVMAEQRAHSVLALIGPEGDFTQREVELAGKAGFIAVSLGESVLRVSTAAVAVASFIRFSLPD